MLKEGDLPTGYGVHKRKLVKLDPISGKPLKKGEKIKKSELVAACGKKSGKKKAA